MLGQPAARRAIWNSPTTSASTSASPTTLLWGESFQSWAELGVSLQPSAKLYADDGTLLLEWLGPFDENEVLELVTGNQVTADPTNECCGIEFP